MSPRILITHGRTRPSYVAAKSLHRAGFEVYVCDASPLNMTRASRAIRGFDRTPDPSANPARYVECLAQIVRQRKIDLLLPGLTDAISIQAHAGLLPSGVVAPASTYAELSVASDKLHIARIAESAGVMVPKTFEIGALEEVTPAAHSRASFYSTMMPLRRLHRRVKMPEARQRF